MLVSSPWERAPCIVLLETPIHFHKALHKYTVTVVLCKKRLPKTPDIREKIFNIGGNGHSAKATVRQNAQLGYQNHTKNYSTRT